MSSIYDALRRIQGQKDSRLLLSGDAGASSRNRVRRMLVIAVVVCILFSAGALTAVMISGKAGDTASGNTSYAGARTAENGKRIPEALPADDGGKGARAAGRLPAGALQNPNENDPLEDVEDYLRQGERYYQTQEYDKALMTYTQALRFFKRDARLLNNIGIVMLAKGQPDKAVNYFRQSRSLSQDSVEPVYNLACAFARLGDSGQAVSYLKTACTMSPEARAWAARDPDLLVLKGVGAFDEIVGAQ